MSIIIRSNPYLIHVTEVAITSIGQISDVIVRLDNRVSTMFSQESTPSTSPSDGGSVKYWEDQSGNGNHFTNATGAVYVSASNSYVDFSGGAGVQLDCVNNTAPIWAAMCLEEGGANGNFDRILNHTGTVYAGGIAQLHRTTSTDNRLLIATNNAGTNYYTLQDGGSIGGPYAFDSANWPVTGVSSDDFSEPRVVFVEIDTAVSSGIMTIAGRDGFTIQNPNIRVYNLMAGTSTLSEQKRTFVMEYLLEFSGGVPSA